jgi:DNA ligase-1
MSKKFPTLYAKASTGKIKVWEIEAKNEEIITRSGYLDGKMSEQSRQAYGKSAGRSNETTSEEQAELEAASKWQKKLDEQYTTNPDNIKSYADQEVLLPMLALNFHKRKHDITFPAYAQPKLNGVRCIYQNGKFMSRKGKEYPALAHLEAELKILGLDIPDGEIYAQDMTFQEIIRRVKKDRGAASEELEYWIYDQVTDNDFEDRTKDITYKFADSHKHIKRLVKVETVEVNSEKEIKALHDKWVKEGFEGAIVRNKRGAYQVKHRSKNLQKFKEFFDAEFVIVGGHEGSGPDAGTVVFEVKTKKGQVFSVRPKGTREMRTEWMNDLKKLVGRDLTVRYQNLSEDGIPIFPVGVCVRDYE